MKIYNSISTKTFTSYIFLVTVIKIILLTTYVSAQKCGIAPPPKNPNLNQKAHIVGFLRQQLPDLNKIKWDIYTDIAYAANGFNTLLPGSGGSGTGITPIPDDDFIGNLSAKAKTIKKTREFNIMLAMGGNFDYEDWDTTFGDTTYPDKVLKFLNDNDFDGVDVEYPKPCKQPDDQTPKFVIFIATLAQKIPQDKFITVTAGPNDQTILTQTIPTTVKRVNIIGYRLNIGLYNNTAAQVTVEGPTSPFDDPNNNQFLTFKKVAENWIAVNSGAQKRPIMMGIEPSGIVRKVQVFDSSQVVTPATDSLVFDNSVPITGLCNNPLSYMRSIQWIELQKNPLIFANHCVTNSSWKRTFDNATKSTYLYNNNQGTYISYEDIESLYHKAFFIKNGVNNGQFGGIMISDISADLNGDLLSIISYIRSKDPITIPAPSADPADPANPSSTNPNSPSTSTTGIIVGCVIGVVVAGIAGFSLLWYFGYKKRQSMALNKSVNNNDYQNVSVPVSIIDKAVPDTPVSRVTALYDFEGKETTDLSFKKGDIIEVIERGDGANDWWVGKIGSKIGEFPGNYVRE